MSDKINEAFERACTEGRFSAESYHPWKTIWTPKGIQSVQTKEQKHEVGFWAYDGRHVTAYGKTKKDAKTIAAKLNSIGSVDGVKSYLKDNF